MAQNYMTMNGVKIWQPDAIKHKTETTYTEDSTRIPTGDAYFTPLFTVEQLGYSAKDIPQSEVTKILQIIAKGEPFQLQYFSMYYGKWRTDTFRVTNNDYDVSSWKEGEERVESLSFNMTGDNPL